jgi:hypothetical protein
MQLCIKGVALLFELFAPCFEISKLFDVISELAEPLGDCAAQLVALIGLSYRQILVTAGPVTG